MAEQDDPLAAVVLREGDGTLRGDSGEFGGLVSDTGHSDDLLFHGFLQWMMFPNSKRQ